VRGLRHIHGRPNFSKRAAPILAKRFRHGDHYRHDHDFLEFALVLAGQGTHISPGHRHEMHPGDVFVIPPGTWHEYRSASTFLLYNCCVGAELIQRDLACAREDPILGRLLGCASAAAKSASTWDEMSSPCEPAFSVLRISLPRRALRECILKLDQLSDAIDDPRPANRARCMGLLLVFLAELADHLRPDQNAAHRLMAGQRATPHRLVIPGVEILKQDIAHAWTLDELSEQLQADPSHVARVFNAGVGLPPMAFLTRLRMEQAAALLLSTPDPISDIGHRVGWDDANYFARRFRAHFGMTASEFRARNAKKRRD